MAKQKEKSKKIKLYADLGSSLQLAIGGYLYIFNKEFLPPSVKNLSVDQSCKAIVVFENSKIVGIKNGSLVVPVRG